MGRTMIRLAVVGCSALMSMILGASTVGAIAPVSAAGGTYLGAMETGTPLVLVIGADGLSVQRLAIGAQVAGGAPGQPVGWRIATAPPAAGSPGQAAGTPFVAIECMTNGRPLHVSAYNEEFLIAGLPVDGDSIWATGGERINWVMTGQFEGNAVTGTYTLTVADCGTAVVGWSAQLH